MDAIQFLIDNGKADNQGDVAVKAGLGPNLISRVKNGRVNNVSDDAIRALCSAFPELNIDYLRGKSDYISRQQLMDMRADAAINVPASYIGTTGQLAASIFGICGNDYTTDVSVTASDANSQTISSVALDDVPMKRNTTTSYSGPLFTRKPTFSMTVADSWGEDITDTW